jgi:hypothetical protein
MFRKLTSILLATVLIQVQLPAQQKTLQVHKVLRGEVVKLATTAPMNSAMAKEREDVVLRVAEPLRWHSVTLLASGDLVHGRIRKVKHAKPSCSDGAISLDVPALRLANAGKVKARVAFTNPDPDFKVPAQMPTGHMNAGEWAIGGSLLAVFLPLYGPYAAGEALARHCSGLGNDYVLPAGATVAVVITEDYNVSY